MDIKRLVIMLNNFEKHDKIKKKRKKHIIIACALDKKGKVLAIRTNDYNCSHPLQKHFAELVGKPNSIYLHAEISVLIAARKPVHTLLIARVDSLGNAVLAKPCSICERAIAAYGVQEIIHT